MSLVLITKPQSDSASVYYRPRPGVELGLFRRSRLAVGLLGGSFNPAHDGHKHLSLQAMRRLKLDAVWWLVTPQNPLKSPQDMAPFAERLSEAFRVANHPRIVVSGIEAAIGSKQSSLTVASLQRFFPRLRFVWLMGADNFVDLPLWYNWRRFVSSMRIAVFSRPGRCELVLASTTAARLKFCRRYGRTARRLFLTSAPAWAFFSIPLHPESATRIRMGRHRKELTDFSAFFVSNNYLFNSANKTSSDLVETMLSLSKKLLEENHAEDIVVIPLAGRTSLADYMVIASGQSSRQLAATAETLAIHLRKAGAPAVSIEGAERGDWVLVDAKDIILHLFCLENRALYNLEKLWSEARPNA